MYNILLGTFIFLHVFLLNVNYFEMCFGLSSVPTKQLSPSSKEHSYVKTEKMGCKIISLGTGMSASEPLVKRARYCTIYNPVLVCHVFFLHYTILYGRTRTGKDFQFSGLVGKCLFQAFMVAGILE